MKLGDWSWEERLLAQMAGVFLLAVLAVGLVIGSVVKAWMIIGSLIAVAALLAVAFFLVKLWNR